MFVQHRNTNYGIEHKSSEASITILDYFHQAIYQYWPHPPVILGATSALSIQENDMKQIHSSPTQVYTQQKQILVLFSLL